MARYRLVYEEVTYFTVEVEADSEEAAYDLGDAAWGGNAPREYDDHSYVELQRIEEAS
jgi:hypothetical protein